MSRLTWILVVSAVVYGVGSHTSQAKTPWPGTRWAPSDLECVAPQGKLLGGDLEEIPLPSPFGFLEGPVWLKSERSLYLSAWDFTDPTKGKGPPTTILKLSGTRWSQLAPKGAIRSNGMAVNHLGVLIAALHDDQSIGILMPQDQKRRTVTNSYQGKPFNSPNDLTVRSDGSIYFTDPDYQNDGRPGQKPVTGVYRVSPQGQTFLVGCPKRPSCYIAAHN